MLAQQTQAIGLVDEAALDEPDLLLKRDYGGAACLDKPFGRDVKAALRRFNAEIWAS
ncbi:hypothetical protein HNQ04_002182 [Deinococcus radiopugnans ATCC 19172]|uniref:Response regulator transcription factor n=1 Tax=Deinococcus radiopugnans ATCC 19172 TaxID=585398 RepID=A0ABR6NSA9_9DEIO|nr:hypothetical protein [Deinococcus radiopugnans ATCC 19172]